MHSRRISGLVLLVLGISAAALGAGPATLADAAEQRDPARIHTLLDRVGIHLDSFADSTGKIEDLFARIDVG